VSKKNVSFFRLTSITLFTQYWCVLLMTSFKTNSLHATCSGSMAPSVFTPVLAVWYLLFLHLFWHYGTFCVYTCSGSMVPSVFTPVLAVEGTIMPEQV
jgi:uncharacterized membrane protein YeiB